MSTTQHSTRAAFDPARLAAVARSILACPASVDLVVDGVAHLLDDDEGVGMQDIDGLPTFSCSPQSPLALAAASHRSALITVHSGLGSARSPERRDQLTLAGRLEVRSREDCDCCGEARDVVTLELNFVLLSRTDADGVPEKQFRVPLEHFRSPVHHLNRGFLQRSVEHANDCHQEELRRAVSTMSSTRLTDVVGVRLTGLSPLGVEVQWVDPEGARTATLRFPRPARTPAELGDMLRRELHAGLC